MRATLHLVSSADYPAYAAALVDARPAYSFMHARLVHLPPSGTYSFYRGAQTIRYEEWVGPVPARRREPMRHLVRRYLAAFGPATIDDMASWMGVPTPAIRAVLDEPPRTFRDEAGRVLYDVARAPLPAEDTPAPSGCSPSGLVPACVLPARAARILPERYRAQVIRNNGDVHRRSSSTASSPVSGRSRKRLRVEPFARLTKDVRDGLAVEGAAARLPP